jgi:hypothetical protein
VGGCLATGVPRIESRFAQLAVAPDVGVERPRLPETGVPSEGGRVTSSWARTPRLSTFPRLDTIPDSRAIGCEGR